MVSNCFPRNGKELKNLIPVVNIDLEGIGMEFCKQKMYHANNEKRETTRDGRNKTTKSRKNQNAWRKGSLKILGNIGSGHHQTCGDKRKNEKRDTSR